MDLLCTHCRDACKQQVNGFKGAQYKKFDSQDAANRFIAGDNSGTGYGRQSHFQQSSAAGNYYGGQNSNNGFHGNGQRSRRQSETYTGHGNQNNSASENRYHPYSGHSTTRASPGNGKYISAAPVNLNGHKTWSGFHIRERDVQGNMASKCGLSKNQAVGESGLWYRIIHETKHWNQYLKYTNLVPSVTMKPDCQSSYSVFCILMCLDWMRGI